MSTIMFKSDNAIETTLHDMLREGRDPATGDAILGKRLIATTSVPSDWTPPALLIQEAEWHQHWNEIVHTPMTP